MSGDSVRQKLSQKVDRSTQLVDTQSPPSQNFDRSIDRKERKKYRTAPKKNVNRSWSYLVDNQKTLPTMDSKDWRPFLNAARGYYRESLKDGAKQELNAQRWNTCKAHFDDVGFAVHEIGHSGSAPRRFLQRVNKEEESQGYGMSYQSIDLDAEGVDIPTYSTSKDLEKSDKENTFGWNVTNN